MTTFDIKLIAIIAMIIDHIGLFFFPDIVFLRVVGRLSFPLFAWLIANGAYHTHDIVSYLRRLFVFALLSQIPYFFTHRLINQSFWGLNVLFTLFLGLLAIYFLRKTTNPLLRVSVLVICAGIAFVLRTDYGALGVLSIVAFYLFFKNMRYTMLSQAFLYLAPIVVLIASIMNGVAVSGKNVMSYIGPIALFSLAFIAAYNNKEGVKARYLFYIVYPLHLGIIYFLKTFF